MDEFFLLLQFLLMYGIMTLLQNFVNDLNNAH